MQSAAKLLFFNVCFQYKTVFSSKLYMPYLGYQFVLFCLFFNNKRIGLLADFMDFSQKSSCVKISSLSNE